MSEFDPRSMLLQLFLRLRRQGFPLGVRELLDAHRAVDGGWGADDSDSLKLLTQLLWCHSHSENNQLGDVFATLLPESPDEFSTAAPDGWQPNRSLSEDESDSPVEVMSSERQPEPKLKEPEVASLPIRAPMAPPVMEETFELHSDWPLTRRSMVYGWRYLRRPVADGPCNILDVAATVRLVARQGFFLQPVYRCRERNSAHLLLLIDQGGSMVPFHRFTRDLVETACDESTLEEVDVAYFHNVPPPNAYRDPHMTEPILLDRVLAECSPETGILIVSDAGAARGYRRMSRVRATTSVLHRLRRTSAQIAWMNPVPRYRWPGTTAQILARMVPMFAMTPDGMSNAVDVLAGRTTLHER